MRAVRADKLCLAALAATLRLWVDAPERLPVVDLARIPAAALEARAHKLAARVEARPALVLDVVPTVARIGGGASPLREIASWALRVRGEDPALLKARLRDGEPPIVARIEDDAVLLDLRCVPESADDFVADALSEVSRGERG
jgi:L-seryl-tRNA(Ser) seleniumtransferase